MRIDKKTVAALEPGQVLFDTELKRFGIRRRSAGGSATYFIKARINGVQHWVTLGKHGPLTPSEARERARKMLADIDDRKYARPDRNPEKA